MPNEQSLTMPTITVANVKLQVTDMAEAVTSVLQLAEQGTATPVRFVNAYSIATASRDAEYMSVLNNHGLNFPDGTPVAWLANRNAGSSARRVRGPSFFRNAMESANALSVGHFLLGSSAEAIEALRAKLREEYPGIKISGSFSPPFEDLTDASIGRMAERVNETDASIVWVALGTPKQDFATNKLAPLVGCPCIGVGAAFDFVAGTVPEAPLWVQRIGMEWMFRLVSQPRRLWKRYLVGNIAFLYAARGDINLFRGRSS